MGQLIFLLGLLAGGALFALLARTRRGQNSLLLGLLWMGSLITILAFLALPWITPGPPDTFISNVEWLAGQGYRLEPLKQLPPLQNLLATVLSGTPQDTMRLLETHESSAYLRQVVAGQTAYGWGVWRMSWSAKPFLGVGLTLAIVASLLGFLTVGVALRGRGTSVRVLGLLTGVVALAGMVVSAMHIPALDSLGSTDHFQLRLISVLGAVEVNTGAWWMCFGLLIIACAGVACYFLVETDRSSAEPNDPFGAW